MQMEIFMTEIGKMIKLMDMGSILMQMVLSMLDIGMTINSMGRELKLGQMVHVIKGAINQVKNMVLANFYGPISPHMKGNSSKTTYKARENIAGQTEELTQEIGKTTKWTDKDYSHGQIIENIKVNI